ncbi:hypothetical protein ACJX0J_023202, partial [Zea mays]
GVEEEGEGEEGGEEEEEEEEEEYNLAALFLLPDFQVSLWIVVYTFFALDSLSYFLNMFCPPESLFTIIRVLSYM